MSLENAVRALAGAMILISIVPTARVSARFVRLTAFVGANPLRSACTGICPAGRARRRIGFRPGDG